MDKLLHCIVSFLLVIVFYNFDGSLYNASLLTLIIGIFKEIYDYIDYGLFSNEDIIADVIGIIIGAILIILI